MSEWIARPEEESDQTYFALQSKAKEAPGFRIQVRSCKASRMASGSGEGGERDRGRFRSHWKGPRWPESEHVSSLPQSPSPATEKVKRAGGGIHHAGHAKDGIGGGLETREPSATETMNNKLAIVAAIVALFLASSLACLLKS